MPCEFVIIAADQDEARKISNYLSDRAVFNETVSDRTVIFKLEEKELWDAKASRVAAEILVEREQGSPLFVGSTFRMVCRRKRVAE